MGLDLSNYSSNGSKLRRLLSNSKERSMRFHHLATLFAVLLASAGCNRQDAEGLSRIGRKMSAHAKSSAGDVGGKIELAVCGPKKEPTLQEKVQDRLRWDNACGAAVLCRTRCAGKRNSSSEGRIFYEGGPHSVS